MGRTAAQPRHNYGMRGNTTAHMVDELVAELGRLRRAGLTELRHLSLPVLTRVAEEAVKKPELSSHGKIETLLREAIDALDKGAYGSAALALFGLAPGLRARTATVRRQKAAGKLDITAGHFQKHYERKLFAEIADKMLVLRAQRQSREEHDPRKPQPPAESGAAAVDAGRAGFVFEKAPPGVLEPDSLHQLLEVLPDFVGREDVLEELDRVATNVKTLLIYAVDGMAGVGKTVTANHWAHSVREHYPDGQLYVDLRGYDPSAEPLTPFAALAELLAPFMQGGPIPATLDGRAAEFRSRVAGKRLMLFLDNARDAEQVRPLLPGTKECLTIVTSRDQLIGLAITHGARHLTLGLMTLKESRELLTAKLGEGRAQSDATALENIVHACAGLPMALSIIGANVDRMPNVPLAKVARDLQARLKEHSLESFETGDPRTNLRAIFSWSYDLLPPETARAFRLLSLNPAPSFSLAAACSLLDRNEIATSRCLRELQWGNLVEQPVAGRYRYHNLLATYAMELAHRLDTEDDRSSARLRLIDHALHSAHSAALALYPLTAPITLDAPALGVVPEIHDDYTPAFAWFDQEREALPLLVRLAANEGHPERAWKLAWTCQDYFRRRGYWEEWADTQRIALKAAEQAADEAGIARTHDGLGRALTWLSEMDEAAREFDEALRLFREQEDIEGLAHVHIDIGTMFEHQDKFSEALAAAKESLRLARQTESDFSMAKALNNTGWYYAQLGYPEQALDYCLEALQLHRAMKNKRGEYNTLDSVGVAYFSLGKYTEARRFFMEALALHEHMKDRWGHAMTLMHLGDVEEAEGQPDAALIWWRDSLAILEQLRHKDVEELRHRLQRHAKNGPPDTL
jgi:tetratricopeptide (TPR) repeat protein